MNYLALGFNIFYRNIILNLILIVQLTVAIGLINMTLGQVNARYLTLTYFEPFAAEKGVYFMPSIIDMLAGHVQTDDTTEKHEILAELADVKIISTVYSYNFVKDGALLRAVGYDSFTADRIRFALRKGTWFTGYAAEEGEVPVVVSSESKGLKLGQSIPVGFYRHASKEKPLIQIKVVGVLKPPPYLLRYNTGGNVISCNDIFERHNESFHEGPVLLFENSALAEQGRPEFAREDVYNIVFFSESISEADYQKNIAILSNHGFVQTLDQMHSLGRKEIDDSIKSMLPYIIGILSIAIVGIVSLNILNTFLHIKTFAIYYLCGSRWKNCFYISLGYSLWIVLLSLGLLLAGFYLSVITGNIYTMDLFIAPNNVLLTGGVYLAVTLLSLLAPYQIIKKASPVEIIREY